MTVMCWDVIIILTLGGERLHHCESRLVEGEGDCQALAARRCVICTPSSS